MTNFRAVSILSPCCGVPTKPCRLKPGFRVCTYCNGHVKNEEADYQHDRTKTKVLNSNNLKFVNRRNVRGTQ